jgi:two-component system, cell cycle sensor histidine kinase PleC
MINGALGSGKANSLMNEYASLLGDAVLRHRARIAEHSARIEAELASRVKSEFISNMSHELRTPLNTVIGFSKILAEHDKRQLPPADVVEYANLIHDAAGHLLSVINDILDISKIQSGRYTIDAREVNLDNVLQGAIQQFRMMAEEAGVNIQRRISGDLPFVRGDETKLAQVFANLLSNAIKFTQQDGVVSIEALRMADGGAVVFVRDTGVGMSEEDIQIAMSPFGQVDGTRSRWREGAGLGLPIARSLVELHGGRMEIKSSKGVGTEVAVILPSSSQVTLVAGREALLGQV